jgi:hypothetical protein
VRTPPRRDRRTLIRRRAVYDAYLASHASRNRRKAWWGVAHPAWHPARLPGVRPRREPAQRTHLHHLTYMRLGDEDDRDLVPLRAKV